MDGVKLVLNALIGLAVFCGILYLAYVSTKYIGKRYSLSGKGNGNLKILDSISLGKDSRLCIVKAGQKYLLLGITQHNISLVSELAEEELELYREDLSETGGMSFSQALKINLAKKFGKEDPQVEKPPVNEEVSDDDKKDVG